MTKVLKTNAITADTKTICAWKHACTCVCPSVVVVDGCVLESSRLLEVCYLQLDLFTFHCFNVKA